MRKKLGFVLLFALLFIYLPCGPAAAQDGEPEEPAAGQPFTVYTLGQQTLSLSAGLFVPLFFQDFDGGYEGTNLKLGAAGSLQWGVHLDNNWMVGLEVGGMFCKSPLDNTFFQLPITVKGSYIIHFFPFEFPIFIGTGMDVVRYTDQTHLNWIIKPGFSTIWKYNFNWGFGLNVVYWWVLQPWKHDYEVEEGDMGRMGNFLELTLTAQYNF